MASFNVGIDTSGINKAQAWLAQIAGQMPYASSRAINDLARKTADDLNRSTTRYFDRPGKFTQRAYFVSQRSSKTNLTAEIRPRRIQERYLLPSIRGGRRPQRPSEERLANIAAWRPGRGAKLSQQTGEISKAQAVRALRGGPSLFMLKAAKGRLGPGIYERGKGRGVRGVRSILLFNDLPMVPKRWPIRSIARDTIQAGWVPLINHYMAEAMRTA